MKLCSLKSLCLVLAFLLAQAASAGIRIYRSSDTHSDYDKVESYVKTTSALTKQFYAQDPKGTVVHLVNGDIAGMGDWTYFDEGSTTYKIFANLAKDEKLLVNLGNHEGFDYRGQAGNDLFKKQTRILIKAARKTAKNKDFKLTTANIEPTWIGKHLFEPYHDLTAASGAKLRVIGLILDDFYKYSAYDKNAKHQAFNNLLPMLDVAKAQLEKAYKDGIHTVLFMCHEEYKLVAQVTEQLLQWKATQPHLSNIQVPVVFAAHDHLMQIVPVGNTQVIDGGSNFQFSMVEFDDNLNLKEVKQFDHKAQEAFKDFSELTKNEKKAIQLAKDERSHVLTELEKIVLGKTQGFEDTRVQLKQERRPLGIKLAETLRDWAKDEIDTNRYAIKDIFAFWNSGTYRMNAPIPAGPVTMLTTFRIYPSPFPSHIFVMKGSEVQRIFESLRKYGVSKNEFTPQISSNLIEGPDFKLIAVGDDRMPAELDPNANYALALDTWLGVNGFQIPEVDKAFQSAAKLETKLNNIVDVLVKYVPKHLEMPGVGFCAGFLTK